MSKMRMNKQEVNPKHILAEMSDSDFLSFLYSERDRENSLSQYQGWNNWALAGALITVVCAFYAICKDNIYIEWKTVLYLASGIMAFFLAYHSWLRVFMHERGIDFSKVRMLKEVIPYAKISLIFVCSICSTILIPIADGFNILFWLWGAVFVAYIAVVILAVVNRKSIVETYPEERMFPQIKATIAFDSIVGGILGWIGIRSFKVADGEIISAEFEIAVCLCSILILLYLLLKINTEDKVIRRFDVIMDEYLYLGSSKEETMRKIVNNRMGYGVLEACSEEIKQIKKLKAVHQIDEERIDEIIAAIEKGGCLIRHHNSLKDQALTALDHQKEIIMLSKKLSNKTRTILAITPVLVNIPEFNKILDENDVIFADVERVTEKIQRALKLIEEKVEEAVRTGGCEMKD